jgi:uncharacterized membrane protein
MWKTEKGEFLIRAGLAFSFIYAGIGGFLKPENWIGWFPPLVREIFPFSDAVLLGAWGALELLLAIWLLSGWQRAFACYAAAFLLFGVTIANWSLMDIVFRDIALGLAAVGLGVHYKKFEY